MNLTPSENKDNTFNMTLAAVVGQVGCFTPVIIIGALFLGLWLDRTFDTKPLFTIFLILGSMPVALFVLFRIVRSATDRLKKAKTTQTNQEEANRE